MYFYCLFSIMLYLRNARISVLGVTTFICAGMLISNLLPEGAPKDFLANPIALEFCFGVILSYVIHSRALDQVWLRYMWLPGLISYGPPERHLRETKANIRHCLQCSVFRLGTAGFADGGLFHPDTIC
jgi:hypothetical protein